MQSLEDQGHISLKQQISPFVYLFIKIHVYTYAIYLQSFDVRVSRLHLFIFVWRSRTLFYCLHT